MSKSPCPKVLRLIFFGVSDGTLLGHGKRAYYYFLHTTPHLPIFATHHVVRIASISNMYYEGLNNFLDVQLIIIRIEIKIGV